MKRYFSFLLLFCVIIAEIISAQDSTTQRIDIRRIHPDQSQNSSYYNKPKSEVFPLGYGTNHLNKVTTGTGNWTELNPKVPRVTYLGLHFVNKDTGWACGQSGAVIKTTNGCDDWTISETPVNNLLLKTHSYNGQVVLVTGYDGIILRSSDAGNNFELIPSGVGSGTDLWGVQMLNDTLGWVCGLNQTLLKTTDAGLNWQLINTGINHHYWSLDFLNEMYGMIACGSGIVLKTTDGGTTWTQTQAGDTRALYTIDVIDSLHIAAAGAGGKNVYSSDGGTTWTSNPDIPVFSATNCIDFIDADTGYTVQDVYNIRKTTNRGQSWFGLPINMTSEWHIQLLEDGTGYSCGEEVGGSYALNLFKRTNGLENWTSLFLNINWSDVFFVSEMKGFFISSNVGAGIYKTEDGGINYQKIENALSGYDLLFLDSLTGFIAGTHKTTDGGETWYEINSGGGIKVFFIDDSVGWSIDSHIYKTTNQGEDWFTQLTLPADNFTSIFFVDNLNGWATSRYIWQTTNSGNDWIQRTDIPITFSNDVYFQNSDTGWIGRYSSIFHSLFKSTDGGINWVGIPEVIGARNFYFFPDPVHWLTIGFSRYYWTNDFGNSWQEFTGDVPSGLVSFSAPNDYLGYSVGNGGLILRYDDTTYVPVELISFDAIVENATVILSWETSSEMNNNGFEIQRRESNSQIWDNIGFVPGHGTTTEIHNYTYTDFVDEPGIYSYRLRQLDYDGSFEYSEIIEITIYAPTKFSLSQNFPNPFNPTTKIKFTIPTPPISSPLVKGRTKEGFVTLKVYDILGNEVATLLNEEKPAGEYKVEFIVGQDSSPDISSGIYFYQLKAGEFSDTKKMLLLK